MTIDFNKKRLCLIGIDAAGKTTHLKRIKEIYSSRGIPNSYLNLRGEYFRMLSFPLLALFRILGIEGRDVSSNHRPTRHPILFGKLRKLTSLWISLFYLDILILAIFRGYFSPSKKIIFSDRCILDSLVDLGSSTQNSSIYDSRITKFFVSVMRPDMSVLLDIPENEALRRKKSVWGKGYFTIRRKAYLDLAHRMNIPIVNSNKPFHLVNSEILTIFNS